MRDVHLLVEALWVIKRWLHSVLVNLRLYVMLLHFFICNFCMLNPTGGRVIIIQLLVDVVTCCGAWVEVSMMAIRSGS